MDTRRSSGCLTALVLGNRNPTGYYALIALLIIAGPSCDRTPEEARREAGSSSVIAQQSESDVRKSLNQQFWGVPENWSPSEKKVARQALLKDLAAKNGSGSIGAYLAENLNEILPDQTDSTKHGSILFTLKQRQDRIDLISGLPPGEFRTAAIIRYESSFAEEQDLAAFNEIYKKLGPGFDRELLLLRAARMLYYQIGDPDLLLKWTSDLEYHNERAAVIQELDTLSFNDQDRFEDQESFKKRLKALADAHNVPNTIGVTPTPIQPGPPPNWPGNAPKD